MTKQDILQRLNIVCKTMDNEIIIEKGIKNYSNFVGCYSLLQEIILYLQNNDINPTEKSEDTICD